MLSTCVPLRAAFTIMRSSARKRMSSAIVRRSPFVSTLVEAIGVRHPSIVITLHAAAGETPAVVTALAEHALSLTTR